MDDAFTTNMCIKRLEVPIGLPLRDWAVVRLADLTVVSTHHTEDDAEKAAEQSTLGSRVMGRPSHYIAAQVEIDRSHGMLYRGVVEILV